MKTILLATHNQGKLHELKELLASTGLRVISLAELGHAHEVEETGATFEANAIHKAVQYSRLSGAWTLADDSGLEIDALDGRPGVHSARYGGAGLTDEQRCRLLLDEMVKVRWEERTARFVCVLALAQGGAILKTFRGVVKGLLAFEPRGKAGFGYDPVFYYPPKMLAFGELDRAEKDAVSHRGQALRAFLDYVKRVP